MPGLLAASASVEIPVDLDMPIGGGILPGKCSDQEAPLRATALVMVAEVPVCIVSLDVLALSRHYADTAAQAIAEHLGIPFANILVTATHTHHAPTTLTVHAYEAEVEFCHRTVRAAVSAAEEAFRKLNAARERPNDCEVELLFAVGNESTVGHNSRWLMDDDQITWCGYDERLMVRPTGPHDPDLPVLAVRRATGAFAGVLFCHATHNIGTLRGNVCSPGVFGLAAQELERRYGAPFLFVPGALGSSHRPDRLPVIKAFTRIVAAVDSTLRVLQPALNGPVLCLKRPFVCRRRTWDETAQEAAVRRWCERWYDKQTATTWTKVFRQMREQMVPLAGQPLETWLQVLRLGEVAVVGLPGEMFGALGLEIRRRSPFRHTVVVGLANDEIGYIPDRQAYADGGYQTWVGFHSQLEPGTGETMVEAALALLSEAYSGPPAEPRMDRLRIEDASSLQAFYNGLSPSARCLFRPLGWNALYADCATVCAEAVEGKRLDYVLRSGKSIVGWAFLLGWEADVPHLGIGVADNYRGKGLGKQLIQRLINDARTAGKQAIELIYVKHNLPAGRLYRSFGFSEVGQHVGKDGNEYWAMRLEL
ncbi:MAG: GNAT family N-acetyltransferase [Candidatus Zipacnadales bacterium]